MELVKNAVNNDWRIIRPVTKYTALYKTTLLLALVILLAGGLRLYEIDRESLWLDEADTYWKSRTSPADIVKMVIKDVHPPLYFLLIHYWVRILGDSDGALRLFSAVFGILAIPIVFQIGRLLFNERFGLVAALFLAVSGFHIQYSQEARSYALYFFLTSLSIYFVLLGHRRTQYAWIGYTLSTVLLLYTHNTAVLVVIAVMLFYLTLVWPWRLSKINPFLIAALASFILYTPWIPVQIKQANLVSKAFWTSELTITETLERLQFVLFPQTISGLEWIQHGLIFLPFSILFLSLPGLWAKEKKTLIAIAFLFLVPIGINLIFSTTIRNIFLVRVLIPALLPLSFLWATPILMERGASYKKLALVAMTLMLLISVANSIDFLRHYSKEPWRPAAEIFGKSYKPGDAVVYLPAYNEYTLVRYLLPNFYDLPKVAIPANYYHKFDPRLASPLNDRKDNTGKRALEVLKGNNARLWLVLSHDSFTKSRHKALAGETVAWLDANYKKLSEWKLKNLEMVLYEPL
jgi:mannosyltransferase